MMRYRGVFLALGFAFIFQGLVQGQDTLRVMNYNLLFFPSSNPAKHVHLKTIARYYRPDVLAVNELETLQGSVTILDSALNADDNRYAACTFLGNTTISNFLYYNTEKLAFHSQRFLFTDPRNTNIYKLYYKNQDFATYPDTIFLSFIVVHLKSSQGDENVALRAAQCQAIRNYITTQPNIKNTFLLGDYNMYTSAEAGYQILLAPGAAQLVDPINRPGSWSNNSSFAEIHTQSPRTASFDGGVTGGLDDRFDINLVSADVMTGFKGIQYIPGTYRPLGNDGQHFNNSIIAAPTNTSAPDSVIQALHLMSDHLPLMMEVKTLPENAFNGATAVAELEPVGFTMAESTIFWNKHTTGILQIADLQGRILQQMPIKYASYTPLQKPLTNDLYIISLIQNNRLAKSWKWAVMQ